MGPPKDVVPSLLNTVKLRQHDPCARTPQRELQDAMHAILSSPALMRIHIAIYICGHQLQAIGIGQSSSQLWRFVIWT